MSLPNTPPQPGDNFTAQGPFDTRRDADAYIREAPGRVKGIILGDPYQCRGSWWVNFIYPVKG